MRVFKPLVQDFFQQEKLFKSIYYRFLMTETIDPEFVLRNVRTGYFHHVMHGSVTYGTLLNRMVQQGSVDQEEARLALIEGIEIEAERVLLGVREGYGNCKYGPQKTHRQRLKELVDRRYIDQEEAHMAIIKGNRILGLI